MKDKKQSLFSWRISEEEMDRQVSQYDKLKAYQSFRGISALILSFQLVSSTLVFSLLLDISNIEVLFSAFIQAVFIYFIYKGHRWAMIISGIAFTANILISLASKSVETGTFVLPVIPLIVTWFIFVPIAGFFIKAVRVENHRRRDKHSEQSALSEIKERSTKTKESQSWLLFLQLPALLRKHSKAVVTTLIVVVVFVVAYSAYVHNKKTETHRLDCLRGIYYADNSTGGSKGTLGSYLIVWNDNYVKVTKMSDRIRRFGTQEEAMEYCLTFLKTEVKKAIINIKNYE